MKQQVSSSRCILRASLPLLLATNLAVRAYDNFPVATNGVIEQSVSAACDGASYLAAVRGDAGDRSAICAQRISSTGGPAGSKILINREGNIPFAAFGGTNFLLVWEDFAGNQDGGSYSDIYGQFINRSGGLVGGAFAICSASGQQQDPRLAFGSNVFLAVWQDARSSPTAVYGRLIETNGAFRGSEFTVCNLGLSAEFPSVTFSSNHFLVTANVRRSDGTGWDVWGRLVKTNGALSTAFQISQSASLQNGYAAAAVDRTNFLVVWALSAAQGSDLYGRLISRTGTALAQTFRITTNANPFGPFLAFDGANYLLGWNANFAGVNYRYLQPTGLPLGGEFALFSSIGSQVPLFSGLLYNGSWYFVLGNLQIWNFSNGGPDVSDVYGMFIPSSMAPARLDIITRPASMRLVGVPGQNYAILGSPSVATPRSGWVRLATNNAGTGSFSFTDTNAVGNPVRFYSAVQVP